MTTIELLDDYFIEIDEYNHTLKKRYIGEEKKTGKKVQKEKIIGYYRDVIGCVERCLRLICLEETNGTVISIREYAEATERVFKRVEEWRIKSDL